MTKDARRRLPRPARRAAARRSAGSATATASPRESCAFDIIGAELMREVQPGEMVSLSERGLETRQVVEAERDGVLRLRAHLLLPPRLAGSSGTRPAGRRAAGWARSSGARRRSSADLVIAVPDSGNPAARGFARASRPAPGRRPDQEPLRRAHVHPARPGAAQARPADEVQPAAGDRRRPARSSSSTTRSCAATRPARSSRCCATPARARCTCGSRAPPIRNPCHYGIDMSTREEMVAHERTDRRDRRASSAPTRSPTSRSTASTRRSAATARGPLRRLLHRRLPAQGHRRGAGQVRAREHLAARVRPRRRVRGVDAAALADAHRRSHAGVLRARSARAAARLAVAHVGRRRRGDHPRDAGALAAEQRRVRAPRGRARALRRDRARRTPTRACAALTVWVEPERRVAARRRSWSARGHVLDGRPDAAGGRARRSRPRRSRRPAARPAPAPDVRRAGTAERPRLGAAARRPRRRRRRPRRPSRGGDRPHRAAGRRAGVRARGRSSSTTRRVRRRSSRRCRQARGRGLATRLLARTLLEAVRDGARTTHARGVRRRASPSTSGWATARSGVCGCTNARA